ncbi:hypothetical protein ANN_22798 [Periplaneta americana]|uniref:Uncharacterized protein n=1 Tax=Periplaneta americana TaxID=6978 RepID=A0ABQ8SJC4_PERAM|nr:hypothetical protein ANN_22798 [Periplaneta americana]
MVNACYYSVEKLFSCSLLSKNLKVRIYKTVILPVVLYGCETWTVTLREEQRLRVFENKVLAKMFGAKRDEVTGGWRKLQNAELHALYSSPDIIRNIKSRRLRWAGHVARMGDSRNAYSLETRGRKTFREAETDAPFPCHGDLELCCITPVKLRGELLRIDRHNTVRSIIANRLREHGEYEVYEEVQCLSTEGSTRRADIIIIDRDKKKTGLILDPTVRFEINEDQPKQVHEEKRAIYLPCCDDLSHKYNIQDWNVIGLMFGARGTIPKFTLEILRKLKVPDKTLQTIASAILKSSLNIINHHLYSSL